MPKAIDNEINKVIAEIKKINDEYNYFTILCNVQERNTGKLNGYYVSVKDCICVKDIESTAGSEILKGYKPVFDATVVKKIKEEGAVIIGKTSQDEFGFGGFSINTKIIPKNPFDKERSCGGSSGGAAGITQKAAFKHIALAESTGGSIVNPACFCGVYGLCPTYGLVSRYGLIDYANSLDKIGVMAKSIEDTALGLSIISGYDEKDSTSVKKKQEDYTTYVNQKFNGRIGILNYENVDSKVNEQIIKTIEKLKNKLGSSNVKEIKLPYTQKYSLACYYILACAEASTNLAKLCGLRYGKGEKLEFDMNKYFSSVRSKYFSSEAKRRIILGTFTRMAGHRDAYYIKALKVRTKIIKEYKKAFSEIDAILSPVVPVLPLKFSEIKKLSPLQNYLMDIMTVGPNLAGLPHINMPLKLVDNLPTGIMAIADHFEEKKLIQLCSLVKSL